MGHHERKCTARSLEMSCNALAMLLQDNRTDFMETVVLLFDPGRALYNGSKTMWSTAPGAPEASFSWFPIKCSLVSRSMLKEPVCPRGHIMKNAFMACLMVSAYSSSSHRDLRRKYTGRSLVQT